MDDTEGVTLCAEFEAALLADGAVVPKNACIGLRTDVFAAGGVFGTRAEMAGLPLRLSPVIAFDDVENDVAMFLVANLDYIVVGSGT